MRHDVNLDWVQCTLFHDTDREAVLPRGSWFEINEEVQPIRNYTHGYGMVCGGKVFVSDKNPEHQGINIMFGGTALRFLRSQGVTDLDVLKHFGKYLRKVTRIDIALDIETRIDWDTVHTNAIEGQYVSKMRFHSRYSGADGGNTLYWGSPKSDKRLRLYDKAAEMGLLSQALTRVELMNRNKIAKRAWYSMLANENVKDTGKQLIGESIKMNESWFHDVMTTTDYVTLLEHEEKQDNYRSWLMDQVLPSIQKRYDRGDHLETISDFADGILRLVYGELH